MGVTQTLYWQLKTGFDPIGVAQVAVILCDPIRVRNSREYSDLLTLFTILTLFSVLTHITRQARQVR